MRRGLLLDPADFYGKGRWKKMPITLSPRLRRIADFVLPGAVVADVGTDHAYIPICRLQSGVPAHAVATDINPGPLRNALRDAERCGVSECLTLTLCDGLAGVDPDGVDTVIAAGMGGETIQNILAAAPWSWEKRLILQPQTKFYELRRWLRDHGLRIADAALSYDAGRLYLVWLVERGEGEIDDYPIDRALIEKRDPLLRHYLEEQIKRLLSQTQGMARSDRADAETLRRLQTELQTLQTLYQEVKTWQA